MKQTTKRGLSRMSKAVALWRAYRRDKRAMIGLVVVLSFFIMVIIAPYISPYDPFESSMEFTAFPSLKHPMGTDTLGRDVLSRVIWGSRVSIAVGIVAAAVSLGVGIAAGSVAGYFGGVVDDVISRFLEVFLTLPRLLLLIVVVALFGSNIYNMMVFIGLTLWPANARIIRAQVVTLKEREYVEAVRACGASGFRMLFIHILPNGIYPALTNSFLQMADAIMTEAGLSFFGLGDLNVVSWGQIIYIHQFSQHSWWLVLFPGIAITTLIIGSNLVGDGLNRLLKPKMR